MENGNELPLITVAVCTRDRAGKLRGCLAAIERLIYSHLDVMVIDNAPRTDAAKRVVKNQFSSVRYFVEPRPGLDWARNRAVLKARGEIIAFTDDDVMVDSGWVDALVKTFTDHPEAMAVTGLVLPYELKTKAQVLFEKYGGFEKGFESKIYGTPNRDRALNRAHLKAGDLGTGANMAFRRAVFNRIGGFDPALDAGTVTCGGGDLEMFFRVIQEGYSLVYEPNAVVRHIHRKEYRALRAQVRGWGTAFVAYLIRSAVAYPGARYRIGCFLIRWLVGRHLIRPLKDLWGPRQIPLDLVPAEFFGSLKGLLAYQRARRMAEKIERDFGAVN